MKKIKKLPGGFYQLGDYEISLDRDGSYDIRKYNRMIGIWEFQFSLTRKELKDALRLISCVLEEDQ